VKECLIFFVVSRATFFCACFTLFVGVVHVYICDSESVKSVEPGRIKKKPNVKITWSDIYYDLQRLYSAYGDDLSHHKFTATVSYRMYVTETISLRESYFVLQTVAYRVIELQWATFA
jgi:hypothetical protein